MQTTTAARLRGLTQRFRQEIALYSRVIRDPECPRAARWILGLATLYAISPIDLIPDFIPLVGHLDDLIVLPILIWIGLRLIPADLFKKHRASLLSIQNNS